MIRRRTLLKGGLRTVAALALGRDFWRTALAAPAAPGPGPYGPLLPPDTNGIMLPQGFTSRLIAEHPNPVPLADGTQSSYAWHIDPDGGGVFGQPDGGWIYVSNSEEPVNAGGVGAVRFDAAGNVIGAYPVLEGTNNNCAGGATPWGTWLSCEENFLGFIYECDPTGTNPPVRLAAMGQFNHEAATVDLVGQAIYLTEDQGDGAFYRFRPLYVHPDGRFDLTAGVVEVAVVGDHPPVRTIHGDDANDLANGVDPDGNLDRFPQSQETEPGSVTWEPVPNVTGAPLSMRYQVPTAAVFKGGEGAWFDDGVVYFTTKHTNRVWKYDTLAERVDVLYDASDFGAGAPLTGVDNIVVESYSGDIYVAEDGGNMELVLITREREVAPFLRMVLSGSEITGPAFTPDRSRLYFSEQRAPGRTFEITGPFRGAHAHAVPALGAGGRWAMVGLLCGAAAWAVSRLRERREP